MDVEAAEEIAANALAFLAADPRRLKQFLTLTGLAPDELARRASGRDTLVAVLDYLAQDESTLLVFAADAGFDPAKIGAARDALTTSRPKG